VGVAFWIAAAGGVVCIVGEIAGMGVVGVVGLGLFIGGVVWFFVGAVARSRKEDVGLVTALGSASRDALRFVFELMP
jgi:hypothetical protein